MSHTRTYISKQGEVRQCVQAFVLGNIAQLMSCFGCTAVLTVRLFTIFMSQMSDL